MGLRPEAPHRGRGALQRSRRRPHSGRLRASPSRALRRYPRSGQEHREYDQRLGDDPGRLQGRGRARTARRCCGPRLKEGTVMLKYLDRTLAVLLALGAGVGHTLGSLAAYAHEPTTLLWSLNTSVLGVLLGTLHLLRSFR